MAGLKAIIAVVLLVLAADTAAAAVFFHTWQPAAAWLIPGGLLISVRKLRRRRTYPDDAGWVLGTAVELGDPDRPRRIARAALSAEALNLGLIAIGAPGSGKTDSVMLGLISAFSRRSPRGGWAFFDGKGDIDTYRKCVGMGCAPDHFFSSELPGSESVNLFEGASHDVIDRLAKVLIGTTDSTSFYMDEQRAVLARMVPLLRALPVATSLRDLYVALSMKDAGHELMRRARRAGADPVEVSLARQWLEQPFATRIRNIAGLLNRLFIFVAGPAADRLNAYVPDIRISALVDGGETLFAHLPLTGFARDVAIALIEMFGVQARSRQMERTQAHVSYPLLFDDWGAFFHDGFGPFSARCRSARMPLSFGFQSHAQLRAIGAGYADELDDTIATKVILRVQGADTARYAVRLLGQYEAAELSTHRAPGREDVTLRLAVRDRVCDGVLRELRPGEAYVSTIEEGRDGSVHNPLWRLQMALPRFGDWNAVGLPRPRPVASGEGLDFWSRYMNPQALAAIHRAAAGAGGAQADKPGRADRMWQELDANPGLDPESCQ